MIAAGSGRCVVPCRLLAPLVARRHGVPRLCRLPAAATAATAAAEQQWEAAGLHSSAAPGVRDLDRLQLDVERKLGIPLEIYRAASCLLRCACTSVVCCCVACVTRSLAAALQAGGVRVRQHVNPLKKVCGFQGGRNGTVRRGCLLLLPLLPACLPACPCYLPALAACPAAGATSAHRAARLGGGV